ncbi:O-methyltransferase [Sphingobacterium faecium]
MNSPKKLNYETRPLKFVERKMLLSSFSRICYYFKENYQYIGLGGISFTDFKLFHKELHIDEMHSIEGGSFSLSKLEVNNPYSFITIHTGHTSEVLHNIDLTKKTIAWLDYDGTLEDYMFTDISILFSKLPIGSLYLITCNKELKDPETSNIYEIDTFNDKFPNQIPYNTVKKDLATDRSHLVIGKMIKTAIDKTIKERNRIGENIKFEQLFNIVYQENRGANMFTYGGIILDKEQELNTLNIEHLEIISNTDDPFTINLPNLTFKEMDLLNCSLREEEKLEILIQDNVFTRIDIEKYNKVYRYLPVFMDIRI